MKIRIECTREAYEHLKGMILNHTLPTHFAEYIIDIEESLAFDVATDAVGGLESKIIKATDLAHRGYANRAFALMAEIETKLNVNTASEFDLIRYYAAMGKVQLHLSNLNHSQKTLQKALGFAQKVIGSQLDMTQVPANECFKNIPCEVKELIFQLYNNIGEWFHVVGDLNKAAEIHGAILTLRRAHLPKESRETLISLNNMAEVYRKNGKKKEAKDLHSEAYQLRGELLGQDHLDTLVSLWNLVLTNDEMDEYIEASILQRRLLDQLDLKKVLNPVEGLIRKYAETRLEKMKKSDGNPSAEIYFINENDVDK